ncbi:MAG: DNRLRE domain-containing protein [bacterium]|nr:DNRLRE domain-containing protein [bacterium]
MIRILTITSLLAFGFANLCFADIVELPSTADTFVSEIVPNTNQNQWDFVSWGKSSNYEIWALIKFGGLADYAGVSLNSAILSLYLTYGDDHGTDDNRVYRITEDWDEGAVTWNTRPTCTTQGELVFDDPEHGWLELGVADLVQDWLDETYINYGFCIARVGNYNYAFTFWSREYSDLDYRPKLTLDFPSPVESSSLGALKAAFK